MVEQPASKEQRVNFANESHLVVRGAHNLLRSLGAAIQRQAATHDVDLEVGQSRSRWTFVNVYCRINRKFLATGCLDQKKEFQDAKLAVEPDPTKALIMGSRDS